MRFIQLCGWTDIGSYRMRDIHHGLPTGLILDRIGASGEISPYLWAGALKSRTGTVECRPRRNARRPYVPVPIQRRRSRSLEAGSQAGNCVSVSRKPSRARGEKHVDKMRYGKQLPTMAASSTIQII